MKKLIALIWILLAFESCIEKEPPIAKTAKGKTTIKGKAVLANTNEPVSDLNVFLWKYMDGVGMRLEVVDETITDSLGQYVLEFEADKSITIEVNYDNTPYLGYYTRDNLSNDFFLDGQTHTRVFEVIPPGWINIRAVNKSLFPDWDFTGVKSSRFAGINLPKSITDTTFMLKTKGNVVDTIYVSYTQDTNYPPYFKIIKTIKYPITVPAFQVGELLIEY